MSRNARVAFVGAGLMGEGMASCLLSAGHSLGICAHRNRAPIDRLLERGATEESDLPKLVEGRDVVMTCLPTSDDLADVIDRVAASLAPGALWIDTSTGHPDATRDLASRLRDRDVRFADAPVTGGPDQAGKGTLASLAGCADADFAEVERIVGAYSKVIRHMGPVGAGHTAKLLNNFVTQGTMVMLGLAYRTARDRDVDWRNLHDAMSAGAGRSGTLEKAVTPALDGDFDGSRFSMANAEKDLRYAVEMFSDERADVARALHRELQAFVEAGRGGDCVSRQLETGP